MKQLDCYRKTTLSLQVFVLWKETVWLQLLMLTLCICSYYATSTVEQYLAQVILRRAVDM